jgi:hypothetical protein
LRVALMLLRDHCRARPLHRVLPRKSTASVDVRSTMNLWLLVMLVMNGKLWASD